MKKQAILHNSHYAHDLNSGELRWQPAEAHPRKPDPRFCSAEDACFAPATDLSICNMVRERKGRYSMTSSARASNPGEMSSPRAFAVLRLTTKSNFLD